tara:strand:+ start:974 stop:1414 length:441 start_codon:yes stop_codon:yes gene_type:complete
MRNTYSTNLSLPKVDIALLIFRLGISALMLMHGIPKLTQFFGSDEISFPDPFGIGSIPSLCLAVFAEFVCSVLIILGLGTRLATLPLIATMAVAVFIIHAKDGMERQELGLIYLLAYVVLLLTGSGKYSLDHIILKRKRRKDRFYV